MVRIQIQLESTQHRAVRRRARRLGVSVAEVIRRCVDAELQQGESGDEPGARVQRALAVAGRYEEQAGAGRTAADHDAALDRAFRS